MDFDDVRTGLRKAANWSGEAATTIVTAGGSVSLKKSITAYKEKRCAHTASEQAFKDSDARFQFEANLLGKETAECIKLLNDAKNLVERLSYSSMQSNIPTLPAFVTPDICRVNETIADFNAAVTAGQGIGIGTAASTGAWMLVAHLGTASTGAAISGLAGVAAHNAILAWFGGGAIAAGGGGMVLGAFAVGGLLTLPLFVYSAFKSYRESSRIDAERQKVEDSIQKNALSALELNRLAEEAMHLKIEVIKKRSIFVLLYTTVREQAHTLAGEMAVTANAFAEDLISDRRASGATQ